MQGVLHCQKIASRLKHRFVNRQEDEQKEDKRNSHTPHGGPTLLTARAGREAEF